MVALDDILLSLDSANTLPFTQRLDYDILPDQLEHDGLLSFWWLT